VKQEILPLDPLSKPDKLLKNGETGKVLMTVPLKNALVIPQKQLMKYRIKICFLVDKNSVVHSQELRLRKIQTYM
jgi:membrane fusion protein (multidrug efflux system)